MPNQESFCRTKMESEKTVGRRRRRELPTQEVDLVSSDDDVSSSDEVVEFGVGEGRVSSSSKVKCLVIEGE